MYQYIITKHSSTPSSIVSILQAQSEQQQNYQPKLEEYFTDAVLSSSGVICKQTESSACSESTGSHVELEFETKGLVQNKTLF